MLYTREGKKSDLCLPSIKTNAFTRSDHCAQHYALVYLFLSYYLIHKKKSLTNPT